MEHVVEKLFSCFRSDACLLRSARSSTSVPPRTAFFTRYPDTRSAYSSTNLRPSGLTSRRHWSHRTPGNTQEKTCAFSFVFFPFQCFPPKRVLCAAQWGDGECCCSHQWELYGCAEVGSLRGRTRRCVCFLSPSLNRKRHPRLLAHSAAASRAGSDHQRQTGFISHIHPHVDFSFFFLFWNTFPKGSSSRLGRNFLEEELRDTCTSENTYNWLLDHKKLNNRKPELSVQTFYLHCDVSRPVNFMIIHHSLSQVARYTLAIKL